VCNWRGNGSPLCGRATHRDLFRVPATSGRCFWIVPLIKSYLLAGVQIKPNPIRAYYDTVVASHKKVSLSETPDNANAFADSPLQCPHSTGMRTMTLNNTRKKYLRTLGHKLDPVVTVAGKGLTEAVLAEID